LDGRREARRSEIACPFEERCRNLSCRADWFGLAYKEPIGTRFGEHEVDENQHHESPPDAGPRSSEQKAVLAAYQRGLARELHVLAKQPRLTFQQLHNRLQWEGGAVEERLGPQRESCRGASGRPWIRTLTRFDDS